MNDAIAAYLRSTRRSWQPAGVISSENTGRVVGTNERPDIIIAEPHTSPVILETEVVPAVTVEMEARSRLGRELTSGRKVHSSLAIRLPASFRSLEGQALAQAIEVADDLEYALFMGDGTASATRWPQTGWIKGSARDLSLLTQGASVPAHLLSQAVEVLENGVRAAAALLGELAVSNPGALTRISEHLCQQEGEQTRRMAATILANALVFHESLARGPGGLAHVKTIEESKVSGSLSQASLLEEWRKILVVNYWPIFDIARRILEAVPSGPAQPLANRLAATALGLQSLGLTRSHDLTGAVFQRLIADREFLAAYYTTPAAASLLAGLALKEATTPLNESWSDPASVTSLRLADFSCGTGTLLSTAYARVGQLHELAGGDAEAIHAAMMAEAVTGCDVLPAAAHLTASMLASAHPRVTYEGSKILTVPFGAQPGGDYALGSINLLDPQRHLDILSITARAATGTGEAASEPWVDLPHGAYHVVLMNPPFVRSTGHEAARVGVPRPMFAAFGTSEQDQAAMARAARRLTAGTCHHGNAGEASIFLELGHRKLAPGGTLAMVMPLSLMMGDSWSACRDLIASSYNDVLLVSISGQGADVAFSADTGMGECLLIARKRIDGEAATKTATFVMLNQRPTNPLEGAVLARTVAKLRDAGGLRRIEDGPVGGTAIRIGGDVMGHIVTAPLTDSGAGWQLARTRDISLAQCAHLLAGGELRLPQLPDSDALAFPVSAAGIIGEIGPYHMDVDSVSSGVVRGPFETFVTVDPAPTYPVLWSHDAERERTMAFTADREGQIRAPTARTDAVAIKAAADHVWASASRLHVNQNFRFNSQSTAMQMTPTRAIGGRAWMTLKLPTDDHEKAMTLWGNSVFGILLHWWQANKQQPGRGNMGKRVLAYLPVFDVTALSPSALADLAAEFDKLSELPLRPIDEIATDQNRKKIDDAVCEHMLGWQVTKARREAIQLLREKLQGEPTIVG